MINWKQKLASRKFWICLVAFIVPIGIIFNIPSATLEQVATIVTSTGALIAYILAEGYVDGKREVKKEPEDKQ